MAFKVLLVDDSSTMRSVIKRTLEMTQLPFSEFWQAGNGKEAIDLMGEYNIDLVLTDINMPGITGTEMIERMQTDETLRSIPVVVLSVESGERRIAELKDKGVKGHIHKPFTPEKIRDVVCDVLGLNFSRISDEDIGQIAWRNNLNNDVHDGNVAHNR